MTLTLANPVSMPSLAARWLPRVAALALAAAVAACGSSKPSPSPLEDLKPTVKVTTVWSHRVGSIDGQASMAVAAGSVTLASTDGEIVSFDIATGRERWHADANDKLSAAVGSDGRYAAVVTQGNELLTFDQGKLLWRERLPGRVVTAPLVAGERVFTQALDRNVRAYDVLDGRWLWQ